MRLWALRWFDFPEIDSGGLLRQIQYGNRLERGEVDHFQRSRLGADALDGDEGIKVVGRNGHSVHDLPFGGKPREFLCRLYIEDGNRRPALIRGDEQFAVSRHAQVINARARGNSTD